MGLYVRKIWDGIKDSPRRPVGARSKDLGSGGAGFGGDYGELGADDAGKGGFSGAGQVLGKDAAIGKFGNTVRPADAKIPDSVEFLRAGGDDFRNGNHEQRLQVAVESPDAFFTHKKLNGGGRSVAGLILAAIYNDKSTEFASFVVNEGHRFGGRHEDGGNKQEHAKNGQEIAVPKSDGDDDENSAENSEGDTEGHPGAFTAAQVKHAGNQ